MSSQKFSVVIPAHNEADTIGRVIEESKRGHRGDVEVIVVCDSCDDATESAAIEADQVLSVQLGSAGASRNYGAECASGETLIFLDADTLVGPDYVESIGNVQDAGCDYGCAKFRSDYGSLPGRYVAASFNRFNKRRRTMGGNCFVRRSLFSRVGGFDVALEKGEDTDLGARLDRVGASYAFLENTYVIHNERRFREEGFTRRYGRLFFEMLLYEISPSMYKRRFRRAS